MQLYCKGSLIALAVTLLGGGTAFAQTQYRYRGEAASITIEAMGQPAMSLTSVEVTDHRNGGLYHDRLVHANVLDVARANAIASRIEAADGKTRSTANVDSLVVLPSPLGTRLITAKSISVVAQMVAGHKPVGMTSIEGLNILGKAVPITGEPNQRLAVNVLGIGLVKITINAQTLSPDGRHLTVTALKVALPTGTILIGEATAFCEISGPSA